MKKRRVRTKLKGTTLKSKINQVDQIDQAQSKSE